MTLTQTNSKPYSLAFDTLACTLSLNYELFKANPYTLGIDYNQLREVAKFYLSVCQDDHLADRLECYATQIEYCTLNPNDDHESLPWLLDNHNRLYKDAPIIYPHHFQEFLGSGISPSVILFNLQSSYHPSQATSFLGYSVGNNYKGWVTWSINPITGITDESVATHFKPDKLLHI